MPKQLQQKYLLEVNGVDVTAFIEGEVTFVSAPEMVGQLSFTLVGREFLLGTGKIAASDASPKDAIKLYDEVYFEGGAGIDGDYNYAPIFRGSVKYVRPQYPNEGTIRVSIEAVDYSYKMALNKNFYVYPSKDNGRNWGQGSSIKASEIVKNMANDLGVAIGKNESNQDDIKFVVDTEYTRTSPLTQRNESDWAVLRKVAKRHNCHMWTDFENNQSELHFVDKSLLRGDDNSGDITFVYPLRTSDTGFEHPKLEENEIPIWDVSVEQDFSAIGETKRVVTKFDYETGEETNYFEAKITEDGKEITKLFTFEIDESKTASLTPEKRRELETISYSIAGDASSPHDINEIAKYFKPAKFYNDRKNLIVDKPYFGITVTATCEGNVQIRARKNYKIIGIGRYGSDSLEGTYFLRTLTHKWGSTGFLTTLELMK
jgi:hypothetical protein